MHPHLYGQPQALSLLQAAKLAPEDDAPRLVLADWLEDHGDADRAEFIRLQLRLAPGGPTPEPATRQWAEVRCQQLLDSHGGAWIGSLWRWWLSPLCWHRGLLAVKLPGGVEAGKVADVLPWVDTALFEAGGRASLRHAVGVLGQEAFSHAFLDLRRPMREAGLLEALAQAPESPCLRSLSFDWPLGLLRRPAAGEEAVSTPAVTDRFFARLLELPVCRHLTHLGSSPGLCPEQAEVVSQRGLTTVPVSGRLWMHSLPPCCFRPTSLPQPSQEAP